MSLLEREVRHPFISWRCRSSAVLQAATKTSSMLHTTNEALDPLSLSESETPLREILLAGLGGSKRQSDTDDIVVFALPVSEGAHWKPARIVPLFESLASSFSSSARLAKTSGSSSSGGNADNQHIRCGSNIMLPTLLAPDASEPTGDPIEDPVKCVMSAGLVEVATTASKSLRAWSLPSHRRVWGFHFISPITGGQLIRSCFFDTR